MRKPPQGGGPPRPVAQGDLFDVSSPPKPGSTPATVARPAAAVVRAEPVRSAPVPEPVNKDGAPVAASVVPAPTSSAVAPQNAVPLFDGPPEPPPPSDADFVSAAEEGAFSLLDAPSESNRRPAEGALGPEVPFTPAPSAKPPPKQKAEAPPRPGYKPYPWRAPVDNSEAAKARTVLSVAELTRQIKGTLERGFPKVCVKGEISGFRGTNPRGHAYFSLKDADACIEVKMWASNVARLKFKLRDGLQVVIEGSVDVYEPAGKYSLIVQKLEPAGEGALALAFQQLKDKLAAEGLLGEKRRRAPRPLPFLPRRIGVVTSRTGAALQDFLRVLYQRHPRASVLVCDSRVQGEGAAPQVVSGIQRLVRAGVDVVVVTRGGGSVEDLWTFNEEIVARAIHACPVPVISAIGHEVDHTIADYVADHRAPTPTAAAQLVVPVLRDLEVALAQQKIRLRKAAERKVLEDRARLQRLHARVADPRRLLGQKRLHLSEQADRLTRSVQKAVRVRQERQRSLTERLQRKRPQADLAQKRQALTARQRDLRRLLETRLREERQRTQRLRARLAKKDPRAELKAEAGRLSQLNVRLSAALKKLLATERARLGQRFATLDAVSPLKVMARGYAVVRNAEGHVVRSAHDVKPGDALAIQLAPNEVRSLADCDEISVEVRASRRGSP